MIYLLGHPLEITREQRCERSADDHFRLKHEARVDRQEKNFNVDESFALCLRCGKAIPLAI